MTWSEPDVPHPATVVFLTDDRSYRELASSALAPATGLSFSLPEGRGPVEKPLSTPPFKLRPLTYSHTRDEVAELFLKICDFYARGGTHRKGEGVSGFSYRESLP